MNRLSIQLFGAPLIKLDETPISVGHSKAVALLAYLAITGLSHSRESLATFLWPDHDTASGLGEVRRILWALNKALGKGWLVADRQTIALDSRPDCWVDVNHFRHLLACHAQHDHTVNELCLDCSEPLTEAIALAQGVFLAGFGLPDSPDFDDWQAQEGQLLHRELAQALQKLIRLTLYGAEQKPEQAITYAQRLLNLDPLHEPTQRLLMVLYAANNQPAAAAQQYQECANLFRSELNASPAAETIELYERIRLGEFDAAAEFDKLPYQVVNAVPTVDESSSTRNLPAQITPFIGRQFEITALSGLLQDSSFPVVSIVAPGGMGKTRLAIELGAAVASHFKDGVFFVELAPINNSGNIIPVIAEAVGYQFQQSGRSQKEQVLDYLANKEALLILDNFEHILDGAEIASELAKAAPRLKILVTSRQRLNLDGETLFTLYGMSLPDSDTLDDVTQSAAIELFLQIARRARPDFSLTAENMPHVLQICRLLQGMPLGILLAAQWVTILSVEEIVEEIQAGLDILEAEGSELPERMRSMRAVFDQSWNMLTEPEQQAFMKLSVFRGGFTRQAGQKVAGAGLRQLQSLVTKGLIERNTDYSRFQIHELLRQYAAEQLNQSGQYRQTRDDHTHYYLTYLGAQTANLKGSKQVKTLKQVEADFENIRDSWEDAVEHQLVELLGQALEAIYLFCILQTRLEDGEALFDKARKALAPQAGQEAHPVWLAAGIRFYNSADSQSVFQGRLEDSLVLAQARDDRMEAAYCLDTLGIIAQVVEQEPRKAIELYERSVALYRQLGEKYYLAQTLCKLGEAYLLIGQFQLTFSPVNEALQHHREIGDRLGESNTLRVLSMTKHLLGNYEEGVRGLEQMLEINLETNNRVGLISSYLFLGENYGHKGEVAKARDLVQQALDLTIDRVDYSTRMWAFISLSFIHCYLGELDDAEERLAQAEQCLVQAESMSTDHLTQSGTTHVLEQMTFALYRSLMACSREHYAVAKRLLIQPMQMTAMSGAHQWLLKCLVVTLALYTQDGRFKMAAEILGLVQNQSIWAVGWMAHWEPLKGIRATLQSELGESAFEAALARGKSRDLKATAAEALQILEADCQS